MGSQICALQIFVWRFDTPISLLRDEVFKSSSPVLSWPAELYQERDSQIWKGVLFDGPISCFVDEA